MSVLYVLCGPSGSGKSTWAINYMKDKKIAYVSRDTIRLSIVKEGEDYFSHEKEVFRQFVKAIAHYIPYDDVIADATHLNEFSRRKLTQALDMYTRDYKIIYVVFNTDIDTCIEHNENRDGRARVPENIIRNMYRDFREPSQDEDERIIDIIKVGE